ncbi:hypothetical protein HID58_055056 [Brassica napus]|uniref:NYN domain-containing protein n=1 Tax=Brassica napus TaxID=3708 RepID=A0ABQ8AK45_BRANA|nr:hypothetical protein HID58_055056 [Brassica napus]
MKATAEYATAKIAVWWDMKDCPIPEGYDSCRIRKILEGAFEEQGYSGPVSITAYGDQTETPGYILQGLFSTGVSVAHTRSVKSKNHLMYRDMVEWRGQNAPPATMMIISDLVAKGSRFSWDLVRQQQRTLYNLFLAYSVRPQGLNNVLSTSEEWCRNKLLKNKLSGPLVVVQGAKFYCKSCNFDSQSPEKFRKHLSSYKHAREEDVNPGFEKVRRYTEDWGRNYKATPEFATAKIQVLWDMFDCPIPEGYDARQVRPSIEAAFKDIGYSGPVSITAYGYHKHTPLQALSSTGVDVVHTVPGYLLAGSEKRRPLLQKCSSERNFGGAWFSPTTLIGKIYFKLCKFDTKSIDNFRAHLLSDEKHAQEEERIPAYRKSNIQNRRLCRVAEYDRNHRSEVSFFLFLMIIIQD